MKKLDEQEKLIVRELIRNPRISDNQIAIKTNVPLKTVNRKRKLLEEKEIISYFCYVDHSEKGTGTFQGREIYIIILKDGITRKEMLEKLNNHPRKGMNFAKIFLFNFIGEYRGNLALIGFVESEKKEDILENFNEVFVPFLDSMFGQGSIKEKITLPISSINRLFRNYMPGQNIKKGIIKEEYSNNDIFVDI